MSIVIVLEVWDVLCLSDPENFPRAETDPNFSIVSQQ